MNFFAFFFKTTKTNINPINALCIECVRAVVNKNRVKNITRVEYSCSYICICYRFSMLWSTGRWNPSSRVTCVTRQKFAWDTNFKIDLRPIYDRAEWYTRPSREWRPTCKDLRPKEDPAASWVTRKWNWQVPRPFLTVMKAVVELVDFNGE